MCGDVSRVCKGSGKNRTRSVIHHTNNHECLSSMRDLSTLYCNRCNKTHTQEELSKINWVHRKWEQEDGTRIDGWGCVGWATLKPHEFTTDSIREQRKKYSKDLLQPFRSGEVSKEYLDAYPEAKSGMIKEGIITETQAKKAKNVWGKDIY